MKTRNVQSCQNKAIGLIVESLESRQLFAAGTGSITGHVFGDTNNNGIFDTGEPIGAARTVFLDLNDNDKHETGEKSTLTDSNGLYHFNNLSAGLYHVRRIFPTGYKMSSIAIDLTLTDGQVVTGADIGSVIGTQDDTHHLDNDQIAWTTGTNMPTPRVEPESAVVDDRMYVFSGYSDNTWQPKARADYLDTKTNKWIRVQDMPRGVTHGAVAVVGKKIWIAGGYIARLGTIDRQDQGITQVLIYDTETNTYSYGPELPAQRASGGMGLINNKLYFTSGHDRQLKERTDTWVLDLNNQATGWKSLAPIPEGRTHFGTKVVNDKLYIMGGQTGIDWTSKMLKTSFVYDPATNKWTHLAGMNTPRSHNSPNILLINNRLYLFGGESSHNVDLSSVVSYDILHDSWRDEQSMPANRGAGAAAYINGKIYFTGGKANHWYADTFIGTLIKK